MTNYAKQIAEMLGLEIGEEFGIKGHPGMGTFWFVDDNSMGLRDLLDYDPGPEMFELDFEPEGLLEQILTGFYEVEKLPWKPKDGEEYWAFTSEYCSAIEATWCGHQIDFLSWKAGICFRTKEEAETKGKEIMEQIKKEYEKV